MTFVIVISWTLSNASTSAAEMGAQEFKLISGYIKSLSTAWEYVRPFLNDETVKP